MKHVMPTLAQGLIECCKMRPDDPVDYLVSYPSKRRKNNMHIKECYFKSFIHDIDRFHMTI